MQKPNLITIALIAGAALVPAACNEKPKVKGPTVEEIAAQKKAYGKCIYDIVKDDLQKIHTQPAPTDGLANVTDILVNGKTVATLTLSADGTSASYNADAKPVEPLTPKKMDDAKAGAPKCRANALNVG